MRQLNLQALMTKASGQAKYLQLTSAIRESIKRGLLTAQERLPSARELALQLSLNRHTVMAAYQELIAQGWLYSQPRKGYFVSKLLPIDSSDTTQQLADKKQSSGFDWQFTRAIATPNLESSDSYPYNFAGGTPDVALFPFNDFKNYVSESLTRPNIANLHYGNNAGFPDLIEQVSLYLRRTRSLTGRQILITNGSQEALYILSQLLLNEHSSVATEAMGYAPAWQSFRSAGANLVAIAQDEQGLIPAAFEQAIIEQQHLKPIKLLYLTPLHQYPTTVTLTMARRHQIYRIAQRHNIAIIEDDYDHEFHYRCQPLAPMASDDPSGLVIYLSTFSKVMFPGARIGFMALDKQLSDAVIGYKTIMNHKVSTPMQDAIARWMKSGAFERHLRKVTKTYHQRRDFMTQLLNDYKASGQVVAFNEPDGGMAMWVEINQSAAQLAVKAKNQGIYLQHEGLFCLPPHQNQDRFIRLGYAGMDEEKLKAGLALLFQAN
ncbi:PLP-dependent aminotransferase family protein [Alteromonadales bacterium alter-6D02]|nr:PLP-dependent aminotransferase family protein [Alteromonadales bacterium alter-6D02]